MNFEWIPQAFDTDILGLRTAKILSISQPEQNTADLIKDLQKHTIEYATYRFPATNYTLIHALEKAGFLLVDILSTLTVNTSDLPIVTSSHYIENAQQSDQKELITLAGNVFSLNRFYNDPLISHDKANRIYQQWMKNSLLKTAADDVFVYRNIDILGFVTMQKNGHIPLLGVSEKSRGKGIARQMIQAVVQKMQQSGVHTLTIETQTNNVPALRSYMSCGFKITGTYVTYRWGIES